MRLADKVVVLCGVGRGMSRSLALLCAQEGAAVVLAARTTERIAALADAITTAGGRALAVPTDMQQPAAVEALFAAAVAAFGRIDGVALLPGGFYRHLNDLATIEPEFFELVLRNHLQTLFWGARHAIPHLRAAGGGAIVTIAADDRARRDANIAYATAKAGVIGLSKNLARELHPHNVRVNCICPGLVRLPPGDGAVRPPQPTLERLGQPEDVAYAALFLLSDESAWLTGQTLTIDGGADIYADLPRDRR